MLTSVHRCSVVMCVKAILSTVVILANCFTRFLWLKRNSFIKTVLFFFKQIQTVPLPEPLFVEFWWIL